LPLLALFTGARLEELGQLRPGDVNEERYADSDGQERTAWFIHVREDSEAGLKLKNASSERRIPVHAELTRLGFISFVIAATEAKQDRLLPLLRPDKYGRLTAKWGEHWSVYRRKVCGVTKPRMVFHSFRHTFKDYARLAGIPESIQRQLMGHSARDVADQYGSGEPDHLLVEAMRTYKVPGLRISSPEESEKAAA
jgi:integrase